MAEFLAEMAASSERRARAARARRSEAELRRAAAEAPVAPPLRLDAAGFDLIAEIKRRSPARGALLPTSAQDDPVVRLARAYAGAGVAAVSVLTEPSAFAGSLEDLERAARAIDRPVLRKDFLVDPYQVLEARVAGASGVLAIVRLVSDARLGELLDAASEAGLFVLVECFDEEDVARAVPFVREEGILVGVNARDLTTLGLDRDRFDRLRDALPEDAPWVAESGLSAEEELAHVAAAGYRLALVGSALVQAADPARLAARMIEAGRAARAAARDAS